MNRTASRSVGLRIPVRVGLLLACMAGAAYAARTVDDRSLPTGQQIDPVGELLTFDGRPVDCRLGLGGKLLFVKDMSRLHVIETGRFKTLQSLDCPGGASLVGMTVSSEGQVYVTNAAASLHVYAPKRDTYAYELKRSIGLPADSFPCGVALSADEKLGYVCLSKRNEVIEVDLESGETMRSVGVGVAPFELVLDARHGRLFVSNVGGRRARAGDQTASSAGTDTVVDERGIASTGTISVVGLVDFRVSQTLAAGLHPSGLAFHGRGNTVLSANANDDTLTIVDTETMTSRQVVVKPSPRLPFGSMPSALWADATNGDVLVALAGNNCVAVVDSLSEGEEATLRGLVPTAWFPTAITANDEHVYVACAKGAGSRAESRPAAEGRNSHDHQGLVQRFRLDDLRDGGRLAEWTARAQRTVRSAQVIDAFRRSSPEGTKPKPVPDRLGQPSLFKHVVYVIKENRTFDQVFGDLPEANSDPKLCVFPARLSPNHHALAKRFGILDNYYCNGVLSADGHSWATEGNVTPYLERAFGGFARSYTFGDDPVTYSSSGFLWDHVLTAGLSFRNYGEMDYAEPPAGYDLRKILAARANGERLRFKQNIGIDRLRRYSCRDYPGWNMEIPDVLRVDRFLEDFRKFEKSGDFPNLSIVYLPQDHFGGSVTSAAHMADNDLALGRLVEAMSKSRYWAKTVIFVNEDDPQGGYDHVDGHRSLCLVVSPYSKGGVNHEFFNQTGVLRTILHVLGLPPLNQQDAAASLMTSCFRDGPDLRPYDAIVPETPLDERPAPTAQQSSLERDWRRILATVPIERTGMKTPQDEENLNRFVWHDVMGWRTPYPADLVGSHGKGLRRLGLAGSPPDGPAE